MEIEASRIIERPIGEVFAAFCDLDRAVERITGIDDLERLEGDGFAVGTRWRETRVVFGKEATEEMTVTDVAAPRSYRVEAASHGMRYVSDYAFREAGGGTEVTVRFGGTPSSLTARIMTPVGWLFRGATKKLLEQDLTDMKVALEGSQ